MARQTALLLFQLHSLLYAYMDQRTAQLHELKNPFIVVLVVPQSGYFKNHKGTYF